MEYLGRDEDQGKLVSVYITRGNLKMGAREVYLIDEKGRFLNTEPLCIIYENYHPWFFDWLLKKFKEERDKNRS